MSKERESLATRVMGCDMQQSPQVRLTRGDVVVEWGRGEDVGVRFVLLTWRGEACGCHEVQHEVTNVGAECDAWARMWRPLLSGTMPVGCYEIRSRSVKQVEVKIHARSGKI